jgi:signal transduction histidine kinase/streptogramin lyase
LSSNVLLDIYEDQAGLLWIGTYDNGLNSFDPETERFTRYQEDPNDPSSFKGLTVTEIYQDSQGILWIGSLGGGLNKYDQERGSFTHFQTDPNDPESINSNSIFSIYEDQQGLLWIGTLGDGLIKFDRENEKFTHVQSDSKDSSSLSNNFVVSIFQDREGILWFGTAGGLNKFDPQKGTFTQYREKDGLSNDWVYGILEDEQGNLWLSTNNGLSKFNSHTETFKNFDVSDGLQSNEFNGLSYHKSNSGEMFFGGINGFNVFFPNQIMENPTIPPIVLTSLAQDGEQVDLGIAVDSVTEATLKWPDNSFEFEFAALSFAHPEKNQYAYYLEGFEETWNEVGTRRYGQYTRLPGGNYTLRVKGSNNDGIWNEVGTAVEITIVPPFWDTWWFRGVVFLAVLGTIFGGYRLRVRSLEARSRELESRFEQRTAELLETQDALRQSELEKAITEERSRLAREMHDSVTQSLYSLTLFSHAARRMAEDIGDDRLGRQIGQIGTTAVKALKEMRLLVYELRPRVLKKEGLIRALRQRLEAVEGRSGVEARLMVDDLVRLPRSVEQELYRIANEALNNTLKHAAATSVVVYLRELDGRIELEVVDDGIGFEPDVMPDHGGMGLESIRERAERLGGKAIIRSAPGEGTSVKVTMNLEEEPVDPAEPAVFQEEDSHE